MRDAAPSRCMPSFTAGSSALLGLLSDYLLPALFLSLGRADWHAWLTEDRP